MSSYEIVLVSIWELHTRIYVFFMIPKPIGRRLFSRM
jgi:hypothetical protein